MTTEGATPTQRDKNLIAAAEELAPHKSLARIEALAKFVFGGAAVVGTAFTGFGLAADSAGVLGNAEWLAVLAVAALGIALVLSAIAMIPSLGKVNADNLLAVRTWYAGIIRARGRLVIAASALLVAAVALAASAGLVGALADDDLDLRLSVSEGAEAVTATAVASVGEVCGDGLVLTLTSGQDVVGRAMLEPGWTGEYELTAAIPDVETPVILSANGCVGGETVDRELGEDPADADGKADGS